MHRQVYYTDIKQQRKRIININIMQLINISFFGITESEIVTVLTCSLHDTHSMNLDPTCYRNITTGDKISTKLYMYTHGYCADCSVKYY